jgi:transposase, IS5 family
MAEQRTFADLAWDGKKKVTRREQFLAEMDRVIPWPQLLKQIAPHYPAPERGRPAMPLERMLRIYFCQQWFDLSDPAAEDALYDSESIRRFVGIDLASDAVPDETTILRFRHLLEAHELTRALFLKVAELLAQKGVMLKRGTIVDATILHAPSSTKNAAKARDPEMRQTRKGNQWYFGMKVHIGTDLNGLTHSLTTTHAAAPDLPQLPVLLSGDETVVYGDAAYWCAAHRELYQGELGIRYRMNRRSGGKSELTPRERQINTARSRHRARVEHAFHVVKHLWGFTKVRYRGLAKNTARAFTSFALANLYLARNKLRLGWATCL